MDDLLLACMVLLLSVFDRLSWLTFCRYSILASATFTPPLEDAGPAAAADLDDEEEEDPCEEMSLPLESRLAILLPTTMPLLAATRRISSW